MNKHDRNNPAFFVVGSILAVAAMGISIIFFITNRPDLALYSFVVGIICALLPFILPFVQKVSIAGMGLETKASDSTIAFTTSVLQDIDLYLEERGNITERQIAEKLATLNQRHLDLAYQYIDGWRTQQVHRIIKITKDETLRQKMRKEFRKLIPLFDALILIAYGQEYDKYLHFYYSRLAFVYKDMDDPDWEKAYSNINFAIDSFKSLRKKDIDILPYKLYEFNRLICAINMGHLSEKQEAQRDEDLKAILSDPATSWTLAKGKTSKVIAPGLEEWLEETKKYELANPNSHISARKALLWKLAQRLHPAQRRNRRPGNPNLRRAQPSN